MQLRPYQAKLHADIQGAWASGARDVLAVLPTGGGKTVTFSHAAAHNDGGVVAIAHRQEIVSQISLTLARYQIRHRIIGPTSVVKICARLHTVELGRSYYDPNAPVAVAGVDTLVSRGASDLGSFGHNVTLVIQDEAHHVLRANKWGQARDMFPNARGLGVTATPARADGAGLGRHADGVYDVMVEGPSMRALIGAGYLADYRIFAPASDVDLSNVTISNTTGDYNADKLRKAVHESHITGDVVQHYLRLANGMQGITFATDVEGAEQIAARFVAAGIPAAAVSAKTPDLERAALLRQFRAREIRQLVNCDLFGEGFDVPSVEVVSMARPTASFVLFCQQFGRALRPMDGKDRALIIDHVGNTLRHGLPDAYRVWTLDRREKRAKGTAGPELLRACIWCTGIYPKRDKTCPHCGHTHVPAARSAPEFVDGDLTELDADVLARLRGAVAQVDLPPEEYRAQLAARYVPQLGQMRNVKLHVERQRAQAVLREAIAAWAGVRHAAGRSDDYIYRDFYLTFGTDILSAQALGTDEAEQLATAIRSAL